LRLPDGRTRDPLDDRFPDPTIDPYDTGGRTAEIAPGADLMAEIYAARSDGGVPWQPPVDGEY
jgi:hypothetical protein